uniref:Type I polyketide synthase n=2 Tax=unclassified Phormidium TaxID=2609805 RepID=A0A2P1CZH3_9CYAN
MQLDNNKYSANTNQIKMNHQEIALAIQASEMVEDFIVLEWQTEKSSQELVAYVVPTNLFTTESLLSHLKTILPKEEIPKAIVPISSIPLTPSGQIDRNILNQLEITDNELEERWREKIQTIPEVEQVAVVRQAQIKPQETLRLSDILPTWKNVTTQETPTRIDQTTKSSNSQPSISHGGELKREKNASTILSQALEKTAAQWPEKQLIYINSNGSETIQTYKELLLDAQKILAGLRKLGVKPQDKIIFQIDGSQDFIPAFWGCILGGFIPVPISIAPTYEQVNNAVSKLHNGWQMLQHPLILTSTKLAPSIQGLPKLLNENNFSIETVDNLRQNEPDNQIHQSQPEDLALLLLTSGSTGTPKAVMLNHRNLLSMTAGTAQNNLVSQDIFFNWMPLEHVGAIVLLGLMAVDIGCQQIHVSTEYILQNPLRWLELIQRHKASISWSPNFAFSLINERASEINQRSYDLSSLRFLVNGGEQIVPKAARNFLKLLQPHGLPANAIRPAFGMSETSSVITWSDSFSLENSSDEMSFVELGQPIPGASIRIIDENNQIVSEGVIGKFQVKGPSVTSGYYQNPQRNQEAFTSDGWFNTGDLGYIKSGRIILTGRDKDDIIINGINYYSHEIESVVEEVEGVEVSYTAACAVRISGNNADQLAIFFNSPVSDQTKLKDLLKKIRGAVVKNVGVNPNYIIPVRKEAIPKTDIGKIQRSQLAKRFAAGEFDSIIQQLGINLENPNLLPNWFYRRTWRAKQPTNLIPAIKPGNILIFLDQLGLGECLARQLEKLGHTYVGIEAGVDWEQIDSNHYRIDPKNPEHYQKLLSELTAQNWEINQIFHLWTYDNCPEEITSLESLEQAQITGVYSLLYLIKALAKNQKTYQNLQLLVASSHSQFISPDDQIAYQKTPVIGLIKAIEPEIPNLRTRQIDLTIDEPVVNANLLIQEIQVLSKETEVAYRQGKRWVPRLETVEFSKENHQEITFKPGGMYLISGGLGGVGGEIAKNLLKTYKAKLLLIGRTPITEATSPKIAAYQELTQLGGEISYEAVDVCDLPRLQQIIQEAKSRWNCQLDGILHLAGSYQERSLLEESPQTWSTALKAKVSGTWVLNQLIKDNPEAIFINFASVISFLGGATVGAYVAANQFLESFTHYQRTKCGVKSYCFSWSLWDGIGISQDYQRGKLAQTKGYCAISTQQAWYSLLIGLHHNQTHLFVGLDGSNRHIRKYVESTYSLEKLTGYFTAKSNISLEITSDWVINDRFGRPTTCSLVQLPQMPLTKTGIIDREKLIKGDLNQQTNQAARPLTEIETQIAKIWQEILNLPEISIHDNFFELGGYSILLVQVQSKLEELFPIPLSIVDMFNYPTISTLAKYCRDVIYNVSTSNQQTESPSVKQGQKRARFRNSRHSVGNSDIAVIGMSCRFPGANNIDEFWQNLVNGVESISFFSDEEVIAAGIDPKLVKNPNYVKAKPILSDIETFDADFFGYSSREAELMDPQARLLLECAWESLEDAGYNPFNYDGAIGIYAGALMNTYLLNNIYPNRHNLDINDNLQVTTVDSMGGLQMMVGNDKDYLTTRISYKLNLTGPSVNVQTACSTSLVTVHLACASLLSGESDMALAGGVSVDVPQKVGHLYQEGMIVTPDGHCRAFDARAQGTIFGSGAGMVLLKRLEDALADGDRIYAVIKGSAINNDGASKVGYMAPNSDGQTSVVTQAISMAQIDPETIGYIEAHGTGTPLGDPIEITGLTQAFRASTQAKNFCGIGSVKTNIGHLKNAAGIAGFIKTVLSLYHKQIPPSLHFEQPNPQLDLPNTPFYVNTTLKDWQTSDHPRRAGVNSLGIGGTNAHVILEEALLTAPVKSQIERPYNLLTLSAKTDKALTELIQRYREYLTSKPEESLADICYTANTGREHFNHRLALVAETKEQLIEQLTDVKTLNQPQKKAAKIAFLFTGQGSQYINVCRQLYDTQPIFRQTLEQCNEILLTYLEKSLLAIIYASETEAEKLNQTCYTQPALFAIEYALYQLWKSWGITPNIVMGHSVGEYVAACVAGVFSLEEGLKLIAHRGKLMQQLPSGGEMVSVMATVEKVKSIIADYSNTVAIAAINSPQSTVISGVSQDIKAIVEALTKEGIKTKQLQVSHAFHSPLMKPMLKEFELIANSITYNQPQIPIISNVTGKVAEENIATAEYWVNHIIQPVQFAKSITTLQELEYEIFVEIGPKPILLGMGRECLPENTGLWLASVRSSTPEWQQILTSLAALYEAGITIDWSGFYREYPGNKVTLPNYPFQRERYWIESTTTHYQPSEFVSSENQEWCYELEWQEQERIEQITPKASQTSPENWLIFADKQGISQELSKLWNSVSKTCILVFPGREYQQISAQEFTINPSNSQDYKRLLQSNQIPIKGIVYLWSLNAIEPKNLTLTELEIASQTGCGGILSLIQSIAKQGYSQPPSLWLVTKGAQPVNVETQLTGVAQSTLWGLGRVISSEHPELNCRLVDLDPEEHHNVENLSREIGFQQSTSGENQIAFRSGKRYVNRIAQQQKIVKRSLPVKADRTYLITGGLGGVGLLVAQWLVEQGAKNLVLVGRSRPKETAKATLNQLEALGAQVVAVQADISIEAEVASLLNQINTTMPPLKGIIHAAGVIDDRLLLDHQWELFAKVFAPKVSGAWNLHRFTQDLDLDFFVLFSSVATILGYAGTANYAAANAFLDTLAHYRRSLNLPGLSINWGPWSQVGMVAQLNSREVERMQTMGINPIAPKQALAVLRQLLNQSSAQATVLAMDWSKFISRSTNVSPFFANFIDNYAKKVPQSEFSAQLEATNVGQRYQLVIDRTSEQVSQVLGRKLSTPELEQGFFDLGMDSLTAVELRNRLQKSFACSLPATLSFDYPNVKVLADYIAKDVLSIETALDENRELNGSKAGFEVIEKSQKEPLAIVGMACRFPGGANSPEAFWELLCNGVDAISEVPPNRWDINAFYDPDPDAPGKMYARYGGFVNQIEEFDAQFFGISPREALSLDPQQRLLLEVSWEALENAAIEPKTLVGSQTGVFVGMTTNDYLQRLFNRRTTEIDAYEGTGNIHCVAAGRLSYILGLTGPSMAVDTACSSSLVTVHLALASLRNHECNLALVGGVNLLLAPEFSINLSKARMLAPDGHCKAFDAGADGYVRAEGCGMIVIKRLSDAIKDKDRILATIRGSAVNQDGRSSGLTVPNGPSQQRVIRQALENSGVEPHQISYIEAHGTGTSLGDPIEVRSLAQVFGNYRSKDQPLTIASVKTNIGHLESAAGIAGLMKVVLQLQHQEIAPHLHLQKPNPHIDWENLPIMVPQNKMSWATTENSRLAGVSSFGISGTNAHLVLEEAPKLAPLTPSVERSLHLFTLSAKTASALEQLVSRYQNYIQTNSDLLLADICYTANTGREHFQHRLALIAESKEQLIEQLSAFKLGERQPKKPSKIAFLFTGQGSQYINMCRQLYDTQPLFRQTLEQCNEILLPDLERSLLAIIYAPETEAETLNQTCYTQPALFAIEYALYQLWKSWGIVPNIVMGHSVGEYVAACVAGVFSLEEGLKLIAHRGKLMQQLPSGGEMVSVMASVEKVKSIIADYGDQVAIAAINSPQSTVISGASIEIEAIVEQLSSLGIKTKQLQVSHAFHSPLMTPMLKEFEQIANSITYNQPQIPIISNVTGNLAEENIATAQYWVNHVIQPVQFAKSMETLHELEYEIFVEIGPKPILLGMGRECLPESTGLWLASVRSQTPEWQQLLTSLGELYEAGITIDWSGFHRDYPGKKVILPNYPFQRERYWIENTANQYQQAEFGSPENSQTPITNFLDRGNTEELMDLLQKAGNFSEEQQKLLPEILATLVKEHQQHLGAKENQEWCYELVWQQQERIEEIAPKESQTSPETWLIFADNQGIAQELSKLWSSVFKTCILVFPGKEYQQISAQEFIINPSNYQDFDRLLQSKQIPIKGIVYLWSLNAVEAKDLTRGELEIASQIGCGGVLFLIQSIAKQGYSQPPSLWLVTKGAQPVNEGIQLTGIAQSTLWGLGRVINNEHPELNCRLVDLDSEDDRNNAESLGAEISSDRANNGENQIAFRKGKRYVNRIIKQQKIVKQSLNIKADATYLITGGMGGIGLLVAQWLVEQGAKYLVLVGRSLPKETAKATLNRLEALGAQVIAIQADISIEAEVASLLNQINSTMPPLKGIIHAAGVVDNRRILEHQWELFAKVFAPKVSGTWNLHRLTQDLALDFFVFFSSISCILGSAGTANYAAANAFLDAMAHYRSSLNLPGLTINWGAWSEVGMIEKVDRREVERLQTMGISLIAPQQGIAVLKQLLTQTSRQVTVLPIKWTEFIKQSTNLSPFFANFNLGKPIQKSEFLAQLEATKVDRRYQLVIDRTSEEVGQVLGRKLSSAELEQGFFELGMDSLMAVELRNRLQKSLACSLPATLSFDYPNVKVLADYLAKDILSIELASDTANATLRDRTHQDISQPSSDLLTDLDELSESEIEQLLAEELALIDEGKK